MRAPLSAILLLSSLSLARADGNGIDLRDLPPIPALDEDAGGSSIAQAAASLAGEDVVVGASKREQSLGNVASAVTVISGDRIRRFGYRTVSEALRAVAGLYVVDDRMSQRLGIRGVQLLGDFNTRILVLIDGATLNEPWNQFVGIGEDLPVSIDDIDRIEVVRGPVSSVYGTNAFLGIINIVTLSADRSAHARGRLDLGTFGTVGGSAGFAVGTVNRQVRGTVAYKNRGGESLHYPEFETANAGSPDVTNDGEESMNAALVAHYDGAFLQLRAYRKRRELAGAPYNIVPGDPASANIDQMVMAEGGYTHDFGDLTLAARAYFNRYQFSDYLVYTPDSNFLDFGDSTWVGAEVRGHMKLLPKDRLGLTLGTEFTINSVKSKSYTETDEANAIVIPTDADVMGVYGEVDASPADWLTLTGGVRFDGRWTLQEGDRPTQFDDRFSPRAGVLLHKGDEFGFKLLYAQGFRNPSPIEAFFADGSTSIANPNLSPETITSYEAVAWARPWKGVNLRLSGFRWDLGNMLQQQSVDTPDGPRLQFQNVFQIVSQGIELEASYRDTLGWYGFVSLTAADVNVIQPADALNPETSARALNSPSTVATLGVSTPAIFGRVHVSTELLYLSSRLARDQSPEASDHLTWNVAIYMPRWQGVDATLGVRNILGTREQIPAQADYDRTDNTQTPAASVPIYLLPGEGMEIYARLGYSY